MDCPNQIIYVLTNPAMPGLIKIGKTSQSDVKDRMKQLYSTGVPVPFECVYACKVADAAAVEKALHQAFDISLQAGSEQVRIRVNPNREFFKLEPERVISLLKVIKIDDITEEFEKTIEADLNAVDMQSGKKLKEARRPRMNFETLGISIGSTLISKDGSMKVVVVDERKVSVDGVTCSLAAATRKLLDLPDGYSIQPSPYWTFNGRTVKEIYDEVHSVIEDI